MRRIARGHTAEDFLRAYRLLLTAGLPDAAARELDDFVGSSPEDRVAVTAGRAPRLTTAISRSRGLETKARSTESVERAWFKTAVLLGYSPVKADGGPAGEARHRRGAYHESVVTRMPLPRAA